ncbi:hypothetical protein ACET3Z_008290 [Daucus carota]
MHRWCAKLRSIAAASRPTTTVNPLTDSHRHLHYSATHVLQKPITCFPTYKPILTYPPTTHLSLYNHAFPLNISSKNSKRRLKQPGIVPAAYAKVMKKLDFR